MDYAALVREHGSIRAAAEVVGISPSTFRDRLRGGRAGLRSTAAQTAPVTPPVRGRSLDAFRAEFDRSTIIPGKIRAALASLGNGWLYETELAQAAGVSLNDLGHYRDEFAGHILIARAPGKSERRVWAGTIAAADQMRAML